jgi:hypothetical protein
VGLAIRDQAIARRFDAMQVAAVELGGPLVASRPVVGRDVIPQKQAVIRMARPGPLDHGLGSLIDRGLGAGYPGAGEHQQAERDTPQLQYTRFFGLMYSASSVSV